MFKSIQDIKYAVDSGQKVCWKSNIYQVKKDRLGQYLIVCIHNNHCSGLTWNITAQEYEHKYNKEVSKYVFVDETGEVLNGKLEDFFVADS